LPATSRRSVMMRTSRLARCSGGPACPAVCSVVWSACRALRGASRTDVSLTPVNWRLTPGSRWMTMEMELRFRRARSSRSATSRWKTRCYRSFAGHLIPALVMEDHRVLWIVQGSEGDMVTCSPDTLRDPFCGSSGRCSDSHKAEVRGLSPRVVWRPALRCLLCSRLLRILRSGNYRIIIQRAIESNL
jgi:hypothetical protein